MTCSYRSGERGTACMLGVLYPRLLVAGPRGQCGLGLVGRSVWEDSGRKLSRVVTVMGSVVDY